MRVFITCEYKITLVHFKNKYRGQSLLGPLDFLQIFFCTLGFQQKLFFRYEVLTVKQ